MSNSQQVTCPLCRTDWGKNALEDLKSVTKQYKEQLRQKRVAASINSKKTEKQQTLALPTDRSFKCTCCKKSVLYEPKL